MRRRATTTVQLKRVVRNCTKTVRFFEFEENIKNIFTFIKNLSKASIQVPTLYLRYYTYKRLLDVRKKNQMELKNITRTVIKISQNMFCLEFFIT